MHSPVPGADAVSLSKLSSVRSAAFEWPLCLQSAEACAALCRKVSYVLIPCVQALRGFAGNDHFMQEQLNRYLIVQVDAYTLRHAHAISFDGGRVFDATHDRHATQRCEQVDVIFRQFAVHRVG